MKTLLDYLQDTYLEQSQWQILEININEHWTYIILNVTIFYPQWWWQPSDTGEIILTSIDNSPVIFSVESVRLNEQGVVYHYWKIISWETDNTKISINTEVQLQINREKRIFNSRNHTAGHLLDIAVHTMWLSLQSTKAYHFESGSYVEYSGNIEWLNTGETKQNIIAQLESRIQDLITQNIKIIVEDTGSDINNTKSPEWKSFRFVYFEWYKELWCGCWGTHVSSTWEIWSITIRKIRAKKWVIKISYEIWE